MFHVSTCSIQQDLISFRAVPPSPSLNPAHQLYRPCQVCINHLLPSSSNRNGQLYGVRTPFLGTPPQTSLFLTWTRMMCTVLTASWDTSVIGSRSPQGGSTVNVLCTSSWDHCTNQKPAHPGDSRSWWCGTECAVVKWQIPREHCWMERENACFAQPGYIGKIVGWGGVKFLFKLAIHIKISF